MRPVRITKALAAADDDCIALSQTPAGAGDLTLAGAAVNSAGVAVLDTPRRVLLTFAASEVGHTFVLYGYATIAGTSVAISETIAGTGIGTVQSTLDFGQVTRVSISAAATGAIKVGTSGVGSTPWVQVDWDLDPSNLVIAVDVSGTVNYTVQYTYDDIMGYYEPSSGSWNNASVTKIYDDPVLAAATADGETAYDNPINAWRVTVNSSTAPGSLSITGIQAGVGGLGS